MSTPFPDPIIKPFSNTGDNAPPPLGPISTAANQETGFPILESTPLDAGGIPVTREEFNGAFNFYTQQILALVSGARFTFNAALSTEQNGYPLGAVLYCASNNSLQRSLVNNNTANFITTPSYINDGINWSAVVIDNIFCKNLSIRDNGKLSLFESTNTHDINFKVNNTITSTQNYVLPTDLPSHPLSVDIAPQVLASQIGGDMYWVFCRESRTTYIQNSLITVPGSTNLTFNTYYSAVNFSSLTDPGYFDVSTGIFTAPFGPITYKIEINIEFGGAAAGPEIGVYDSVSNVLLGILAVSPSFPIGSLIGSIYITLNHAQTIYFRSGVSLIYGNSLPFVSNQLSMTWYTA